MLLIMLLLRLSMMGLIPSLKIRYNLNICYNLKSTPYLLLPTIYNFNPKPLALAFIRILTLTLTLILTLTITLIVILTLTLTLNP